jgi:phosphoribosyl-AMP cyclohydrolase
MMAEDEKIELAREFTPRFDERGLIPVIAQDAETGQVLMLAYMNDEALRRTVTTGRATYYSRSRKKLWTKGEQSGHAQNVKEILVDCDQDCLLLKVAAAGGQCHAGYASCFYRRLDGSGGRLSRIMERVFDPDRVYGGKKP